MIDRRKFLGLVVAAVAAPGASCGGNIAVGEDSLMATTTGSPINRAAGEKVFAYYTIPAPRYVSWKATKR